jgi:hypothetical protein
MVSEARTVDVRTGRPVASPGTGICDPNGLFGPPDTSGCLLPGSGGPQSHQLFDDLCRATVGVASIFTEALANRCLLDLPNENSVELISAFLGNPRPVTDPLTQLTFSGFFANLLVGNRGARNAAALLVGDPDLFLPLNVDPCDGFLDDCATPGPPANSPHWRGLPERALRRLVQLHAPRGFVESSGPRPFPRSHRPRLRSRSG